MRSRSVVTALLSLTAGVAVSVVARRLAARRPAATARAAAAPIDVTAAPAAPVADQDAVVLPFTRQLPPAPEMPAPEIPAPPARCGENGGRTKAGAPCAARATSGGRCHHHRVAA